MSATQIKVSIVVPIYNVERYLEKCIKSLVAQTIDSFEILLINDGSKDGSGEIAKKMADSYENVYYYEKENGGLSDARNFGIPLCRGKYIGFVDSDDYVEPTMFETLYKIAEQNNSDIVMCDYYKEYEQYKKQIHVTAVSDPQQVFYCMLAAAWNKLYKKSVIIDSGVRFPVGLYYEDTAFFSMLIPSVKRIDTVNEAFVHYVQREGSIANSQGIKTEHIFQIFDKIIEYYKENDLFDEYYGEIEYLCVRVLLGSSLERMSGIADSQLRRKCAKDTIEYLKTNFPDWKKNAHIKNNKTNIRHLYMLCMNKATIILAVSLMYYKKKFLNAKMRIKK